MRTNALPSTAPGQRDYMIEKRYDGQSVDPFSKVKIDWTYDALNRLVAETRDADPTPGTDTPEDFGTPDATLGDYTDFFGFDLAGNRLLKLRGWDANGNGRRDAGDPVSERIAYRYNARAYDHECVRGELFTSSVARP